MKEDSPGTAVGISAILVRNDNNDLAAKAIQTNNILKSYCSRNRIPFLSNSNMNASHLNMRGLHLNRQGSLALQQNLLGFAKLFQIDFILLSPLFLPRVGLSSQHLM